MSITENACPGVRQYAITVPSQFSLLNSRMTPFARSYSTSNFSRRFWPKIPAEPMSLPPTKNSIFLISTPTRLKSFTVATCTSVDPPMPLTVSPDGPGDSLSLYSAATAELIML